MKSRPEISVDTRLLYQRLLKTRVNEIVAYAELSATISRDVRKEARHSLRSAIRRALHVDNVVFEAVTGVGIKRLDDAGIAVSAAATIPRVRRAARRGLYKMAAVQRFEELPQDVRTGYLATQTVLGAVAHLTNGSRAKKIDETVSSTSAPLSFNALAALLK